MVKEKKSANRLKKEKDVQLLSQEIPKYPVVALFKLASLPTRYLQKAKSKLRGQAEFRIVKGAVMSRALKAASLPDDFITASRGSYGLILTSMSPFKLFKELKRSRGAAYAKPGQAAPADITIPAGETPFPAGPVLSEFKQAGLDVKIVGGKIHISKDKVMVKKGEPISDGAAKILQKLDIKPFDIGVELDSAFRGGVLYTRDVLDVDEQEYLNNMVAGFSNARNLAVEVAFPTASSISLLLVKAHRNARNLAVSEGIPEKEVIGLILAKAQAHASAISARVPQSA